MTCKRERVKSMSKFQDMPPTQTKIREEQRNKIDGDLSLTLLINKNKIWGGDLLCLTIFCHLQSLV